MTPPRIGAALAVAAVLLSPQAGRAQGWDPAGEVETPSMIKDAPSRGILPRGVDLSSQTPPPRSQGASNTCVSWAVSYAAASQFHRRRVSPREPDVTLSPALSYNLVAGESRCLGLSSITNTLNLLRDVGALPLERFAFDPGWCGRMPTGEERAHAARYRIRSWAAVDATRLEVVKSLLANETPVIFGMVVGPQFARQRTSTTFDIIEGGTGTMGHAMVVVGYDDERQAFRVQNSAGKDWGDGGYFWLSYRVWAAQVRTAYIIEN